MITLEIEKNEGLFKSMERVSVGLQMGERAVDIEILKKGENTVEQDQEKNLMLWIVNRLEGSAVLSFASDKLQFEDIFPIDVKFEETYSLIDLKVEQATNAATGEALSLKTIHSLLTENYRISE